MSHKQLKDTIDDCLFSFDSVAVSQETRVILHPMSFTVPKVAGVAVVGVSGSGKTTILRALLGLVEHAGAVEFLHHHMSFDGDNIKLYKRIGVLFQKAALLNDLSVIENCRVAQELSSSGKSDPEIIEKYLRKLHLWQARDLFPWQLSGGMQHRAGLVRALVRQSECLILDEPTTGQDAESAQAIQNVLLDYQTQHNGHLIMVSHDYTWLKPLVQWSILVHEGRIEYLGPMLKAIKATQEEIV